MTTPGGELRQKDPGDEEQEVTTSLAAAKEISTVVRQVEIVWLIRVS